MSIKSVMPSNHLILISIGTTYKRKHFSKLLRNSLCLCHYKHILCTCGSWLFIQSRQQAKQFIQWIRDFDAKYGIDPYIPEIRDEDLDEIADSIMVEIFVYPNKKVYTRDEIKHLLKVIRGDYANA